MLSRWTRSTIPFLRQKYPYKTLFVPMYTIYVYTQHCFGHLWLARSNVECSWQGAYITCMHARHTTLVFWYLLEVIRILNSNPSCVVSGLHSHIIESELTTTLYLIPPLKATMDTEIFLSKYTAYSSLGLVIGLYVCYSLVLSLSSSDEKEQWVGLKKEEWFSKFRASIRSLKGMHALVDEGHRKVSNIIT